MSSRNEAGTGRGVSKPITSSSPHSAQPIPLASHERRTVPNQASRAGGFRAIVAPNSPAMTVVLCVAAHSAAALIRAEIAASVQPLAW